MGVREWVSECSSKVDPGYLVVVHMTLVDNLGEDRRSGRGVRQNKIYF